MKLSTFNIDWGNKQKSKSHVHKIEQALNALDSDLLIITESVDLDLPAYNFVYKTKAFPKDQEYEGLNYSDYLNSSSGYRVSIYSKYQSSRLFKVIDEYTSICNQFETSIGTLTIYATIIGTWFKKQPYAEKELHNCINDCMKISQHTNSLCLTGDLNTSFLQNEKHLQISNETTKLLLDLCKICNFDLTTGEIENNIDHIFLPQKLKSKFNITSSIFVAKDKLSDHQGVVLDIKEKYIS